MAKLDDPTGSLTGRSREIYDRMLAKRARQGTDLRGPYLVLMNNPELAEHIEQLGYFFKFESRMPRDVYQFIVLYLARIRGDAFSWKDHLEAARTDGLPDEVISALSTGNYPSLPARFTMVRAAVERAVRFVSIPEDLQSELIAEFGVDVLLEIVTVTGFYSMISSVDRCFDV